ncbi:S1C family serine protease [Streptomyces xanthii]|uniref:Trypsin-like peptidase domain-containing protein n=1 Tax=Streptomyces xanthii TaxID=2768069 RepID=A0A7H1B6C7_9ACTN|nr:trypsin-like peptidase domain-containing protein [Streptomyces xanthii]QNS04282.1 trypsin-like peptidase domain-containing protein [Streptomyces xanthii]
MDEGKPTKAKWWSRPRPSTGDAATTDDGDWHLPAPASPSGAPPAPSTDTSVPPAPGDPAAEPGAAVQGVPTDEWPPPVAAAPASPDTPAESAPGSPASGDSVAESPAPAAAAQGVPTDEWPPPVAAAPAVPDDSAEPTTGSPAAPATPGDPVAEAPAPGAVSQGAPADEWPPPVAPAPAAASAEPSVVESSAPGEQAPVGPAGDGAPAEEWAPPVAAATVSGAEPVVPGAGSAPLAESPVPAAADGPRPLHDPDPYSTPPYGEPGPWALAPPVQHPMATPTHGTPTGAAHPQAPQPHAAQNQQPQAPQPHPAPNQQPHQATPPQPHHSQNQQPQPHPQAPQPVPAPAPGSVPPAGPWQLHEPWGGPVVAAAEEERRRKRKGRRIVVIGAAVIALVAGGIGGAVGSYLERTGGTDIELPQAGPESAHRDPGSVAGIAATALPGVVTIHTKGDTEQGTGTGFVLDQQGHILTNNHVVEPAGPAGEISVTFAGGESADAEVVGHDSGYDLAVIKVKGVSGLKPLRLGNSENVQVGDPVVAIGAPFDLANTVTSGIISAKERPITAGGDGSDVSYVDALQTDAPINPGNSGGPLVDSRARVIGINSAIRGADGGSEQEGAQAGSIGLGFAIPINQAKRVAEELINTGKATHPVIGVTLDMDYDGDGARVGTKGNDGGPAVTAGGPAAEAGIRSGDVITEVDGTRVHSGEELIVKVRAHRPKDKLDLTVERDGKPRKVTLVLGSADGD